MTRNGKMKNIYFIGLVICVSMQILIVVLSFIPGGWVWTSFIS